MSMECSECERDLRAGHDRWCSRYVPADPHRQLADLEARLLQGQTPLGAEFEAIWDANVDKLHEHDGERRMAVDPTPRCDLEAPPTPREAELMREIERLRALLARYRDETPLGHQPHMIAAEVDAALGRR